MIPYQKNEHHANLFVPRQNYENYEINRITCENHENHENLIVPLQNNENHEIRRIPCQNNENQYYNYANH